MRPSVLTTLARHDLVHPDGRSFHVYGDLHGTLAGQPADHDVAGLHLRHDLLTNTWIAVSPARNARPGGTMRPSAIECPLCPGGVELPFPYEAAVFDNRFPALSPDPPEVSGPFVAPSSGRCQVVVYTSDHEGSLSTLAPSEVARVVAVWRDRSTALWNDGHRYVMAFENHGAEIGATLSHPHGQIYAFGHLPPVVRTKLAAAAAHRRAERSCLGCTLVDLDAASERIVSDNASFTVAVPFAARWPFEVHIRARRHGARRLADLTGAEALDLAIAIRDVVNRYDRLFAEIADLPYMLCVQEAPRDDTEGFGPTYDPADWHLHVELLPPHRSATRLKVRASVETALGVFINDTLPERSAERLAAAVVAPTSWTEVTVPTVHQTSQGG